MTAIADRPTRRPDPGAPAPGGTATRPGRGPGHLDIWVEVSLFAVTATAIAGMGRLFANGSFLVPLLLVAAAGHLCAAVARRRGMAPVTTVAFALGAGTVVALLVAAPGETLLGLPTPAALAAGRADLAEAWRQFGEVTAPAPVLPGFVLASAIAVWVVAWFSDWAALRVGAVVEAVLPAAALFLFASMLGDGPQRVPATLAFVTAVGWFAVLQRTARLARTAAWVGDPRDGRRASVAQGLVLVAVAALVGAAVGPALPGAESPPVIDWKGDRGRPSTRITVSPLVDIRSRLIDQSDTVVFTVRSTQRAYWRLTSLDRFDGTVWSSGGRFGAADGNLPADDRGRSDPVVQDFRITGLSTIWLPAAFAPTRVDTDGARVRYDDESGTLIVDSDRGSSDGITYRVTSHVPDITADDLRRGSAPAPPGITGRYLDLPAAFPPTVANLATAIGRTSPTAYGKALALQAYFRDNFTYDLRATNAGHSDQAIEAFLTSGRGYCEQFAGTYAAMARAMGLPSRVAVGFTPGDADGPDRYIVKGKHAHAWPEVWLGQAGWVAFEPTPGRGAPGAQSYTGVAEAQVGGLTTPTTAPTTATTAPADLTPTTAPPTGGNLETEGRPGGDTAQGAGGGLSVPGKAGVALVALLVAGAAWIGGLAAALVLRRRRRRRRAVTPAAQVGVAWIESTEAAARLTQARRPWETHHEFASRAASGVGPAAEPLGRLATLAEQAAWAPEATDPEWATEAEGLRSEVDDRIRRQLDTRQRLRDAVDPRPLRSPR